MLSWYLPASSYSFFGIFFFLNGMKCNLWSSKEFLDIISNMPCIHGSITLCELRYVWNYSETWMEIYGYEFKIVESGGMYARYILY